MQWNEALAITGLAFLIAPLVMVWPLVGLGIAPLDAWFESVSGVTTTGLTTLRDVSDRTGDFLFLRAWMQWYGGLGIAALTVALIMRHHAGARRLLETTGESFRGGVGNVERRLEAGAVRGDRQGATDVAGHALRRLTHQLPIGAIAQRRRQRLHALDQEMQAESGCILLPLEGRPSSAGVCPSDTLAPSTTPKQPKHMHQRRLEAVRVYEHGRPTARP